MSKDLTSLQEEFTTSLQQANEKRKEESLDFQQKPAVNKKEHTLALGELRSFVKTSIKRHDKSLTALKEGQSQLDKNMAELRQEVTEHSNQVQNSIESLKTFITQQFSAQNPPVMANPTAMTNAVSPLGER